MQSPRIKSSNAEPQAIFRWKRSGDTTLELTPEIVSRLDRITDRGITPADFAAQAVECIVTHKELDSTPAAAATGGMPDEART